MKALESAFQRQSEDALTGKKILLQSLDTAQNGENCSETGPNHNKSDLAPKYNIWRLNDDGRWVFRKLVATDEFLFLLHCGPDHKHCIVDQIPMNAIKDIKDIKLHVTEPIATLVQKSNDGPCVPCAAKQQQIHAKVPFLDQFGNVSTFTFKAPSNIPKKKRKKSSTGKEISADVEAQPKTYIFHAVAVGAGNGSDGSVGAGDGSMHARSDERACMEWADVLRSASEAARGRLERTKLARRAQRAVHWFYTAKPFQVGVVFAITCNFIVSLAQVRLRRAGAGDGWGEGCSQTIA